MKKKYFFQLLALLFIFYQSPIYASKGVEPTSKKIEVTSNSFKSATDPGWSYSCNDGIEVELKSMGLKNNVPATLTIQKDIRVTEDIERIVVEIVYKGKNPGATLEVQDDLGTSYIADREIPAGGSSSVWYYRFELPATTAIHYTNTAFAEYAQSILAYVFRKRNNGTASSGVFTALSGYNDIKTATIPIQTDSGPRTVTVELPISELTPDGRYIHIEVSAADGSFAELTEAITDFPSGSCCIKIFELVMKDVSGSVDEIEIKIDTRHNKNGQQSNGQSWVMGGAVKTNVRCSCVEFDTEPPVANNLEDYIIVEDMNEVPEVTFSDNCSLITVEYSEYYSRKSCEIDFGPVYTDSNIWFTDFPGEKNHHWNKGYYVQFINGTSKIYGKTFNNAATDSGWDIEVYFDKLEPYSTWINNGGSTSNDAQKELREYGQVDFDQTNEIIGFGTYKNDTLHLKNSNAVNYMDIGPRDVYGEYGIGFYAAYDGTVNGVEISNLSAQIEMNASLKRCVSNRDGAHLIVREWRVTDAAGNTNVFIQRVELEYY